MEKFKGVIYQAINIQNKKSYIGKTVQDFEDYKQNHIDASIRGDDLKSIKKGKYFYNALRKYGLENFKWVVLGEIIAESKKELKKLLNEAEKESIWLFRTFGSDGIKKDNIYGYNMTPGGDGGDTFSGRNHSEKSIQIIGFKSRTIKKKRVKGNPNKGKTYEEIYGKEKAMEQRDKRSGKNNKKAMTEEGKISKKLIYEKDPDKKKRECEKANKTREMRGSGKGKKHPKYIDIDISIILKLKNEGKSIKEIALIFNVGNHVIRRRLKNPDKWK